MGADTKLDLPNFLIVGAAKSGTTSLYNYLSKHPDIYMPEKIKEPYFLTGLDFNKVDHSKGDYGINLVKSIENYKKLFSNHHGEKAIGEASVGYLYFYTETIKNIKKYLVDPKIIIVLRNPIDRAYSNYLHHVRDLHEDESFDVALKYIDERMDKNYWWGYDYIGAGMYFNQIKAYLENFENVKIILFDDFTANTDEEIKKILIFLEVDSNIKLDTSKRMNVSGVPKNKRLQRFLLKPSIFKSIAKILMPKHTKKKLKDVISKKNLNSVKMKYKTREYLKEVFKDDILKVQDLIKKDLSFWIK